MANEKKKRLGFNLFDAIIIVLVLLVAAVGYLILGGSDTEPVPTITATYTLRLNDLPEGSGDLIRPGESMKENVQNISIGTVVAVEVIPCYVDSYDPETGRMVAAVKPGRETLLITLQAEAVDDAAGLTTTSGFVPRVGKLLEASAGMVSSANGSIVQVERVEG